METTGSLLLTGNVPKVDATAVARLKAAGVVMVGKTNCPEFAMDIHTANRVRRGDPEPVGHDTDLGWFERWGQRRRRCRIRRLWLGH